MRQLATSTLTNQSLATALLTHTYTADADRKVFIRVFADQVAGNGTYVAYITVQRLGAGSAYEVQPRSSVSVASGITAISFVSTGIPLLNTDVLKVYLLGLAGDTTTPDIITGIWEDDYLRATTADRTLDVSSTGEAGVDWANVGSPTSTLALTGTTVKTATDVETDTQDIQGRLPAALASGRMSSDAVAINGSTGGAANLALSTLAIVNGAAITGTLSSTQMTTNLTEATNSHYVGRVVYWTSGVLNGQASTITGYTGSTKLLTYSATQTAEAPSNGDTFSIL